MSVIEITGFAFFVMAIVWVGVRQKRTINNLSDYIVSGRSLSFSNTVGAILSTWVGAGSILGLSSEIYRSGSLQAIISLPLACSLGLFFMGLLASSKIRRYRCYTIGDIIEVHYGKYCAMLFALLMALQYFCIVAAQFSAMGLMFHHFTGMSTIIGSLLCALCVGIYVHRGGLWSLITTDLIQVKAIALMSMVSVFTLVFFIHDFDLFSVLMKNISGVIPPHLTSSSDMHAEYWGLWLMGIASAVLGQDIVQRILAAKSDRTAKSATCTAALIFFMVCMVPILVGLAARESLPDLVDSQRIFPLLIEKFGNKFILFIFNIGLIATILGSADSMLLAGSSLLTKNVALVIAPIGKDNEVPLVRICNIIVIMLAFTVSCTLNKAYVLIVYSSSVMLVSCFVPFLATLILSSPPLFPAFISFVSGLSVWVGYLWWHSPDLLFGGINERLVSASSFYGFVASVLGYALTWLMISRVRAFYSTIKNQNILL